MHRMRADLLSARGKLGADRIRFGSMLFPEQGFMIWDRQSEPKFTCVPSLTLHDTRPPTLGSLTNE